MTDEEKGQLPAEEAEGSSQESSEEVPTDADDSQESVPDADKGGADDIESLKRQLAHAEELIGRQSQEVKEARQAIQNWQQQQQQMAQQPQEGQADWFQEMTGAEIDRRMQQMFAEYDKASAYRRIPGNLHTAMKNKPQLYKGIEDEVQKYTDAAVQMGLIQPQVVDDPRTYHSIAMMVRGSKSDFDIFSTPSKTVAPTSTEMPSSTKGAPEEKPRLNKNDPLLQEFFKHSRAKTWDEFEEIMSKKEGKE